MKTDIVVGLQCVRLKHNSTRIANTQVQLPIFVISCTEDTRCTV